MRDRRSQAPTRKSGFSLQNLSLIITMLVAVGGFVFGIYTFQITERNNETLDFKRKLWEKKLEVCYKLSDIVGDLVVNRENKVALDSIEKKFNTMYYSGMIMIEDSVVEATMVDFSRSVRDFKRGRKDDFILKTKAIELMKTLSAFLRKKQKLPFDEDES